MTPRLSHGRMRGHTALGKAMPFLIFFASVAFILLVLLGA